MPSAACDPAARAVVEGEIQLAEVAYRRRRQLLCRITDGTGSLTLRFFYFSGAQQAGLTRGTRLRCFGEIRRGPLGLEIVHPEYRRISADAAPLEEVLTPIYPTTEGVPQPRLRALIDAALREAEASGVRDWIPQPLLAKLDLPPLLEALTMMHRPPREADLGELLSGRHPAQRRLAFEELLAHQLSLRLLRQNDPGGSGRAAARRGWPRAATAAVAAVCAHRRAVARARRSRSRSRREPPDGAPGAGRRGLRQDGGGCRGRRARRGQRSAGGADGADRIAGRTACEEFRTLVPRRSDITVALVTGSLPARTRRSALEAVASGEIKLVVGTHALFQESMEFARLGLVIVDEQHRFGVHQRLALREKGARGGTLPHQLIMTATPIPRTLAMTAYADLDVSVIDELPPGRTPIRTSGLSAVTACRGRRTRARAGSAAGSQAYWVCPLIEESEELRYQAAEETAAALAEALPDVRVGLVHGRMPAREKERGMYAFKEGRIGLLVATTVIEVGVDVPNATLMVIENAERMGLAQLHQLRGRVGRGAPGKRLRAALRRAAERGGARASARNSRDQRRLRNRPA